MTVVVNAHGCGVIVREQLKKESLVMVDNIGNEEKRH
jgi:hypothetical protein